MNTPDPVQHTVQHSVQLQIDGHAVRVAAGTSVAAALRIARPAGLGITRRSVTHEPRAPLCGMGICQECRVLIDGRRRLACQTHCTDGMAVDTSA
ncbi:MAG: (2Fe-2S)-binding protein [Rhodoferax sp.]|nr:(2Fe-2S)-binding protein [Rhodoferax sp.]